MEQNKLALMGLLPGAERQGMAPAGTLAGSTASNFGEVSGVHCKMASKSVNGSANSDCFWQLTRHLGKSRAPGPLRVPAAEWRRLGRCACQVGATVGSWFDPAR